MVHIWMNYNLFHFRECEPLYVGLLEATEAKFTVVNIELQCYARL